MKNKKQEQTTLNCWYDIQIYNSKSLLMQLTTEELKDATTIINNIKNNSINNLDNCNIILYYVIVYYNNLTNKEVVEHIELENIFID